MASAVSRHPIRYIQIAAFCTEGSAHYAGYSVKAVQRKIEKGQWRYGQVLHKAPDGHTMIDLVGYEAWVESESVAA